MIFLKYILVGLLGSGALFFLAKIVMAGLLQRDTDYYMDRYEMNRDEEGGEEDV